MDMLQMESEGASCGIAALVPVACRGCFGEQVSSVFEESEEGLWKDCSVTAVGHFGSHVTSDPASAILENSVVPGICRAILPQHFCRWLICKAALLIPAGFVVR